MRLSRLRKIARLLERDFVLKYKSLRELPNSERHYGDCSSDKRIRVRLKQRNRNVDLADSTVLHTLCHEFAHLACWEHGAKHRAILRLMLRRAKELIDN